MLMISRTRRVSAFAVVVVVLGVVRRLTAVEFVSAVEAAVVGTFNVLSTASTIHPETVLMLCVEFADMDDLPRGGYNGCHAERHSRHRERDPQNQEDNTAGADERHSFDVSCSSFS